jgi:hypothetical protein
MAMTGNKSAERWTREKTISYLGKIEECIRESNPIYLGHALLRVGLYNDIWSYWREKWAEDEEIYDRMMMIRQHFENRIFSAALQKEVHTGVAIFALKVHYGWCTPRPANEGPVPSEPQETVSAPAPKKDAQAEPASGPSKDASPLVIKIFPDTSHLIPVSSYCGLPTFIEAGKRDRWIKCGKQDFVKVGSQ